MRMHWKIVAGAAALSLIGAATTSVAQEATLRYRWKKGEDRRTRVTQRSSTTFSAAGLSGGPGNGTASPP
jgi:hypothetical protein